MAILQSMQVMCEMGVIECETKNEAGMKEMPMSSSRLTRIEKSTLGVGFLKWMKRPHQFNVTNCDYIE